MADHPILFTGAMVRAILDGSKTQTRRVITAKHAQEADAWAWSPERGLWESGIAADHGRHGHGEWVRCPYGVPGDRLWVRETWAHYQTVDRRVRFDGASFSEVSDGFAGYRADGHDTIEDFREHVRLMSGLDLEAVEINGDRWRPSIHMPRWASRITLEVTAVRVERVQDISEEDARAEGVDWSAPRTHSEPDEDPREVGYPSAGASFARQNFRELWDSINAARGYSWESNPWVWAVGFRRIEGTDHD